MESAERQRHLVDGRPEPARTRWQPLRSGILNLFRFDEQEFWYEQGRLLLRGNNGTGKSRVLALQLPFLLDGEIASYRVEPDRDHNKRMEWNLLLGKFKDRRGYTWIEFGRRDGSGSCHYLTLGCGLQAVEGRGVTARWYFITPQRVGMQLSLTTPNRQPLTREQLSEKLQPDGRIFTTAQDYRREVDRALFHLGQQRYESLIELLITLRQPQLTRTLDESALSAALCEALPPLSQKIIDDVAESMRGLEVDREQLDSHRAAAQAIEVFLGNYENYAGIASRRKAAVVRRAHREFEETGRQLRTTESELESAITESSRIAAGIEQLKVQETRAETEQATLLSSPQMAAARELDAARRAAEERQEEARQARDDDEHAAIQLQRAQAALETARRRMADAERRRDDAHAQAAIRSDPVGLRRMHDEVLAATLAQPRDSRPAETARALVLKAIDRRREQGRLLRGASGEADLALDALEQAKRDRDRVAQAVDGMEGEVASMAALVSEGVEQAIAAYRQWGGALVELSPASTDELADSLREWVQTGTGETPLTICVQGAVLAASERLARLETDLQARAAEINSQRLELEREGADLLAGRHEPPAVPYTRPADARRGRPGAPFWALCEFEDSVSPNDRAGLEAALEASGLLDAWVLPSGQVLDASTQDCFLAAKDESTLPQNESLHAVLRPCADQAYAGAAAVEEQVLTCILRSIGLGPGAGRVWVDPGGSWCNGPLSGHWEKPNADHVGPAARQARRERRIIEVREQIRRLGETLQELADEAGTLSERRRAVAKEQGAAPRDEAIRNALAAESQARRALAEARSRLTAADAVLAQAHRQADAAASRRDETARDLGLSDWVQRLDDLEEAITRYRESCSELWPAFQRYAESLGSADAEESRVRDAASNAQERHLRARQAELRAQSAQARYRTLEQTQGSAVQEVVGRLEQVKRRLAEVRERQEEAFERSRQSAGQVGRLQERAADLRTQRAQQEGLRDEAIGSFRRFVISGLLGIAIPVRRLVDVGDWSTTRLVELARETEAELSGVDSEDDVWERHQRQLFEQFKTLEDALLQHDHRPEMSPVDDAVVIKAIFQGRHCAVNDLRDALHDEVTQRQTLLDAREREIIENHLIGEVAQHLHDRLRQAEQHVRDMNAELERAPTSSGMVLRLRWEAKDDGPVGLLDARRRLLGAVGTWSAGERDAVGRFLHERIKTQRMANDTGTWQEQLMAALDYRSWHDFVIERNIDGQWKRLTRRSHGTASGGEKVIALMIPMFAAAASHYRSAAETAPRLILLDEAFVGVDSEMRARCMGLLRAFDLDFIMTSEREWCCYSTLPGVTICQLSARAGLEGIYVSRWVWNGRERLPAPSGDGDDAAPVSGMAPPHAGDNGLKE